MEKKKNIQFTNEEITKKFKSKFELVNYAIKLAENMILTGRKSQVDESEQNPALNVIREIAEGKDKLEEIVIKKSQEDNQDFMGGMNAEILVFDAVQKGKKPTNFSISLEE